MKIHLKTIVVVGLLALLIPVLLGYVATTGAVSSNTTKQHAESKNVDNKTCNGCHDYLANPQTGAGGDQNAHRRHFVTGFLNFANNYAANPLTDTSYGCAKCHMESNMARVYENDTSYNTTASAYNVTSKQVRPDWCQRCHGQFVGSPSASATAHGGLTTASTCVTSTCHTIGGGSGKDDATFGGDPLVVHGSGPLSSTTTAEQGAWWVDQRYANSSAFCSRCHGALAWYQADETNPTP